MAERVQANGVALAFERAGEGPAVVFVHGLGGAGSWRDQANAVREAGFDATAIALRGAGQSEVPEGPYSVELWAADLVAAIDALGIGSAALVGHSVGCMIAEHAAVALGGRCTALALLGGRLRWPEGAEEVFEKRARLAEQGRMREVMEMVAEGALTERGRANPELMGRFEALFMANDPRCYAESARATVRGSMRELERVECTVLSFAGSEDAVTTPEAAGEIAGVVADGESAVVEGGAHWCQMEFAAEVNEILVRFLQGGATG